MEFQCSSFCTGGAYDLRALSHSFSAQPSLYKFYGNDVLWLDSSLFQLTEGKNIFVYEYGCAVLWGCDDSSEITVIEKLHHFLSEPLQDIMIDRCSYRYLEDDDSEAYVDTENDQFIIDKNDICVPLSFSYALSQSIKIAHFEKIIQKTIENNKEIPESLIKTGKISLSRSALAKKIGRLFYEKNAVNLNRYMLNTPEFFWKRPKYEIYYDSGTKFMDISQRIQILNNRIDVINELYTILAAELSNTHSARIELIITVLIALELFITIMKLIFR